MSKGLLKLIVKSSNKGLPAILVSVAWMLTLCGSDIASSFVLGLGTGG